jgi:hypothetical protein
MPRVTGICPQSAGQGKARPRLRCPSLAPPTPGSRLGVPCYPPAVSDPSSTPAEPTRNRATFVLADISGYTRFLEDVGEAHGAQLDMGETPAAYPLMTTLLESIVRKLVPPFTLAKLEGDAVFAYADDPTLEIRGPAVADCLQACYASFRDHLRRTEAGLTCTCDACSSGAKLDLKFVLHHGSYVAQAIAGNTELLGPDVTAVHRMLKNDVTARTGWQAYALLTMAAANHLEVPTDAGMAIDLTYEHVGRIEALVLPLVQPA